MQVVDLLAAMEETSQTGSSTAKEFHDGGQPGWGKTRLDASLKKRSHASPNEENLIRKDIKFPRIRRRCSLRGFDPVIRRGKRTGVGRILSVRGGRF